MLLPSIEQPHAIAIQIMTEFKQDSHHERISLPPNPSTCSKQSTGINSNDPKNPTYLQIPHRKHQAANLSQQTRRSQGHGRSKPAQL